MRASRLLASFVLVFACVAPLPTTSPSAHAEKWSVPKAPIRPLVSRPHSTSDTAPRVASSPATRDSRLATSAATDASHPSRSFFTTSTRTLRSRLDRMKLTVEWEDAPLEDVVRQLSVQLGCNMVLAPAAAERAGDTVSLKLTKLRARSVLDLLSSSQDLEFLMKGGVVLVTTPEDAIRRTAVLRVYDVASAMYRAPDFRGPEIVLRGSGGYDDFEPEPLEEIPEQRTADEILDLIQSHTGDVDWDAPGVSIDTFGSRKIVVRHTPEVQRRVLRMILAIESF